MLNNQFLNMVMSNPNPQQMVMNILQQQMGNTPMGQNLITLAQNNRSSDIEKIARNIVNQRGGDFDKEFSAFKNMLGIK